MTQTTSLHWSSPLPPPPYSYQQKHNKMTQMTNYSAHSNQAASFIFASLGQVNTLRPRQNGGYFTDNALKCILLN